MYLIPGVLLAIPGIGSGVELALALLVTCGLAVVARSIRAVTTGGAILGALLTSAMVMTAGPGTFAAVGAVFLLAWGSTRFGRSRKQGLGESGGERRALQVGANLGTAAAAAVLWAATHHGGWLVALVAALAEAAGDTVSSECGQALTQQARLVTTWETVAAGVDGAVSLPGTAAGIAGALLVAGISAVVGIISPAQAGWAAGAATIGMFADSYLGALLQRRGWLSNDSVNLISTILAAGLGWLGAPWAAH